MFSYSCCCQKQNTKSTATLEQQKTRHVLKGWDRAKGVIKKAYCAYWRAGWRVLGHFSCLVLSMAKGPQPGDHASSWTMLPESTFTTTCPAVSHPSPSIEGSTTKKLYGLLWVGRLYTMEHESGGENEGASTKRKVRMDLDFCQALPTLELGSVNHQGFLGLHRDLSSVA